MCTNRFARIKRVLRWFEDPTNTLTLTLFGCLLFCSALWLAGQIKDPAEWQQYGIVGMFALGTIIVLTGFPLFAVPFVHAYKQNRKK